jgi:hypothetical protein
MLGLVFAGLLAFAQARTASVEGVVFRAGTSQPVSKAVVELSGNNLSPPLVMATGGDGKFGFSGLAPGSYRLAVSREGYMNGSYGQRGLTEPARLLSSKRVRRLRTSDSLSSLTALFPAAFTTTPENPWRTFLCGRSNTFS